jgi:hypothetical protein
MAEITKIRPRLAHAGHPNKDDQNKDMVSELPHQTLQIANFFFALR